jgi:NAD(P)-dependent dehydrogenase (short-subunit alcohol dehydrogenase family)
MADTDGDRPFAGKIALVTGASKGIGAATALALGRTGAHVVITARTASELEAIEEQIHEDGGSATIAPMDLGEQDSIARLASAMAGRWDRLDILVHAAAYLPLPGPVAQIDAKDLTVAITTNVLATQALIASFDPLLRRSEAGRVIGFTSGVVGRPFPYWGGYGATKAASDFLLECYWREVEKVSKIRVAIVDPGAVRTQMRARAFPGEDPMTVKPPEVVADRVIALLQQDFTTGHREVLTAG